MGKKEFRPKLKCLCIIAALLSLLESALIVAKLVPPVLFYSPANIIFSLAGMAVVAYTGVIYAKEGLKKSAINGAIVSFASATALCLIALFSHLFLRIPIIGITAPDTPSMLLMLLSIAIENALLGGIIAGLAAWVKRRIA